MYGHTNASNPELFIIQNPAQNLNPEEKIKSVRYITDCDKIKQRADKVKWTDRNYELGYANTIP